MRSAARLASPSSRTASSSTKRRFRNSAGHE
jgi:hypothetical protein